MKKCLQMLLFIGAFLAPVVAFAGAYEDMLSAVSTRDADQVNQLLQRGGWTPLIYAAFEAGPPDGIGYVHKSRASGDCDHSEKTSEIIETRLGRGDMRTSHNLHYVNCTDRCRDCAISNLLLK